VSVTCPSCGGPVWSWGGQVVPEHLSFTDSWPRSEAWWTDCQQCGRVFERGAEPTESASTAVEGFGETGQ
jgi:hypothetical protein